jgi:hypothetical protein
MKCLELRRLTPELLDDLRREMDVLKALDHPRIVRL